MKNVYTRSFEIAPPPRNTSIEGGFTLTEVLITLGIIGVVAALTMGLLIPRLEKITTAAKLKKFYNTIARATDRAMLEHGDWSTWDYSLTAEEFYKKYYKNQLTVISEEFKSNGVNIRLSDGTCTYFRKNTSNRINIANFYWTIYTNCLPTKSIQGRSQFELALFNFKNMKYRCNYTPTLCGFSGDGYYEGDKPNYINRKPDTGSCSDPKGVVAWEAYKCFYKFIKDGMKFSDDYIFYKKW